MMMPSPLFTLRSYILIRALHFLAPKDLASLARTSRDQSALVRSESLWHVLCLAHHGVERLTAPTWRETFEQVSYRLERKTFGSDFDAVVKTCLLGDAGIGKTQFLARFAGDELQVPRYIATIGVDFKMIGVKFGDHRLKLQMWDTAGQERFRVITSAYIRGTEGIFLCFDVSDRESFDHLDQWHRAVQRYANDDVNLVVVGLKSDQKAARTVTSAEAEEYAKKRGYTYVECSAQTGHNVDRVVDVLLRACQKKGFRHQRPAPPAAPPTTVPPAVPWWKAMWCIGTARR